MDENTIHQVIAELDELCAHVQRRIDALSLTGEALAFEQGRLDGAHVAGMRIRSLIEENRFA